MKNKHQKTINALCRKLDKAESKRDAANAECDEIASAIRALGGVPAVRPTETTEEAPALAAAE